MLSWKYFIHVFRCTLHPESTDYNLWCHDDFDWHLKHVNRNRRNKRNGTISYSSKIQFVSEIYKVIYSHAQFLQIFVPKISSNLKNSVGVDHQLQPWGDISTFIRVENVALKKVKKKQMVKQWQTRNDERILRSSNNLKCHSIINEYIKQDNRK